MHLLLLHKSQPVCSTGPQDFMYMTLKFLYGSVGIVLTISWYIWYPVLTAIEHMYLLLLLKCPPLFSSSYQKYMSMFLIFWYQRFGIEIKIIWYIVRYAILPVTEHMHLMLLLTSQPLSVVGFKSICTLPSYFLINCMQMSLQSAGSPT